MKNILKKFMAVIVVTITCIVALATLVVAVIGAVLSEIGDMLCRVTDRLLTERPETEDEDTLEEVPAEG